MKLEYIKSVRGADMLRIDNYLYSKDKSNPKTGKIIWKCYESRTIGCLSRVHTMNGQIVHTSKDKHCHEPYPEKCEKKVLMNKLKSIASSTPNLTPEMVNEVISEVDLTRFGDDMASKKSLANKMRRVRLRTMKQQMASLYPGGGGGMSSDNGGDNCNIEMKEEDTGPCGTIEQDDMEMIQATNCLELQIKSKYRYIDSTDGVTGFDLFLLFDSSAENPTLLQDHQRLLIFSTEKNLKILEQTEHWLGYGKFDSKPSLFGQFFVIHGIWNMEQKLVPLVYALMSDSSTQLFSHLFQQLKALRPSLNPRTVLFDLELQLFETFQMIFPSVIRNASFIYHYRFFNDKLDTFPEISDKYRWDLYYQLRVKMLPALAFVPADQIPDAFDALVNDPLYDDIELDLINYYDHVWIRGAPISRTKRHPPLYPPAIWSCYDAIKNRLPDCAQRVDAWHNLLSVHIADNRGRRTLGPSVNICKFIEILKLDQRRAYFDSIQNTPLAQVANQTNTASTPTAAGVSNGTDHCPMEFQMSQSSTNDILHQATQSAQLQSYSTRQHTPSYHQTNYDVQDESTVAHSVTTPPPPHCTISAESLLEMHWNAPSGGSTSSSNQQSDSRKVSQRIFELVDSFEQESQQQQNQPRDPLSVVQYLRKMAHYI